MGWIPGSGRSSAGHGNSLQYSCLGDPMDRGACWATVHKVAKSQTLKRLSRQAGHWVCIIVPLDSSLQGRGLDLPQCPEQGNSLLVLSVFLKLNE